MAKKNSSDDAVAAIPAKIKLTCPFGFYDANDLLHMWQAGQEVTDPDEVSTLLEKGAEHTVVE